MDTDWTKYRAKHRTSHFGQTQGQGQDIKQFGVDRGQGKWPKLRIWKLTTHITMGHGLIGGSLVRLWDISLILSKYQILKRTYGQYLDNLKTKETKEEHNNTGQHLDISIIHIKANFCHSLLLLLLKRKHTHLHTHMTKGSMKGGKIMNM